MATRSTIALEYADGTVDQVYCHWDGYLDHNGEILREHYKDPFKVRLLMDLGDLSSLGSDIGDQHEFSNPHTYGTPEYEAWNVEKGDVCTFYGRDRGEEGTKAKRFANFADYERDHQYEEYEYILRTDGNWYVYGYNTGGYQLLNEAIEQEKMEEME